MHAQERSGPIHDPQQPRIARLRLDGATAVLGIIGDPVAQVKAPLPLTQLLQAQGLNAVLVPLHVAPAQVPGLLEQLLHVHNFAGLVATVPHKQQAAALASRLSRSAREAQAANVLRRTPEGWEGDLLDGTGFVAGLERNGVAVRGARVAMAGAGGAGNAIAFALAAAGVAELSVRDADPARQAALVERLRSLGYAARAWEGEPQAELLVNATPCGMRESDPLPIEEAYLRPGITVAEVIMEPARTRLLQLAQALGARTVEGRHMMECQLEDMAAFFGASIRALQAGGAA